MRIFPILFCFSLVKSDAEIDGEDYEVVVPKAPPKTKDEIITEKFIVCIGETYGVCELKDGCYNLLCEVEKDPKYYKCCQDYYLESNLRFY